MLHAIADGRSATFDRTPRPRAPILAVARLGLLACGFAFGGLCGAVQPAVPAAVPAASAPAAAAAASLSDLFAHEVDRRLEVPPGNQPHYIALLQAALTASGTSDAAPQAYVMVDRSPQVQAVFVIVRTLSGGWQWVGAAPVSTGKAGSYDHFLTPLGVFAHTLANPDFRAEGTFNENHVRGYGLRGRRVFDFGWAAAERGWGAGGVSQIRLQMHATDPNRLEARLGEVESKGCIRIPAAMNVFLDRHGILDADYDAAVAAGRPLWVLGPERAPIASPGRYLVVIDSAATERPGWSPLPDSKASTAPEASAPATGANARLARPARNASGQAS